MLRGSFRLRSGAQSSYYIDKYLFTTRPDLLRRIADELALRLPNGVQRVAGPVLGAIPLISALSLAMEIANRQSVIFALAYLACVSAERGDIVHAGRLWGAIESEESRGPLGQWESEREQYAARLHQGIGSGLAHPGGQHLDDPEVGGDDRYLAGEVITQRVIRGPGAFKFFHAKWDLSQVGPLGGAQRSGARSRL